MNSDDGENFQGFLIRLFNKPPKGLFFTPGYHFHVLGYYDGLVIQKVNDFESYYVHNGGNCIPSTMDELHLCDFEEQRLCLYVPTDAYKFTDIFDYNNGDPFLVLTEIQLGSAKQKITYSVLEKEIEKTPMFTGIKKQLFCSLGFFDFVLAFRLKNFELVKDIIVKMREINKVPVQSTYSIACFSRSIISNRVAREGNSIDVSLRIGLKKKQSFTTACNILNQYFKGISENTEPRRLMGRYDEEIRIHGVELFDFLDTFLSNNDDTVPSLLDPRGSFYHENIKYTNTRLMLSDDQKNKKKKNTYTNKEVTIEETKLFSDENEMWGKRSIFNIIKYIEENKLLPPSPMISINRLVRMYFLTQHSTLADIKNQEQLSLVIKDFLSLLLYDLDFNRNEIELIRKGLEVVPPKKTEPDLESLEEAILVITSFIHSQTQASSHVFESPAFNAKFIGSLRGVLSVYSSIVEKFERIINGENFDEKSTLPKNNFFTTIDHSTKITTSVLFPAASYNANFKLTTIKLDISSFFNINKGIPYVIHEIGHGYFFTESIEFAVKMACNYYNNAFFTKYFYELPPRIISFIKHKLDNVIEKASELYSPGIVKCLLECGFDVNQLQNQEKLIASIANDIICSAYSEDNEEKVRILVDYIFEEFSNFNNDYIDISEMDKLAIADYLDAYHLIEKTQKGQQRFIENLYIYLTGNLRVFANYFLTTLKFVSEICADSLMVRVLEFDEANYSKLVDDNLEKQRIPLTPKELDARKKFIYGNPLIFNNIQNEFDGHLIYLCQMGAIATINSKCDEIITEIHDTHVGKALRNYRKYFPSAEPFSSSISFIAKIIDTPID